MTKSFLEPLGANKNALAEKLIREEFISGMLNESHQRMKEEEELFSNLTQTMKEFYQKTNSQMFVRASTQNCSDMIVNVGMHVLSFLSSI
jgi:hypothetical protein